MRLATLKDVLSKDELKSLKKTNISENKYIKDLTIEDLIQFDDILDELHVIFTTPYEVPAASIEILLNREIDIESICIFKVW